MSEEPTLTPEDFDETSQGKWPRTIRLPGGMSSQPSPKAVKPPLRPHSHLDARNEARTYGQQDSEVR